MRWPLVFVWTVVGCGAGTIVLPSRPAGLSGKPIQVIVGGGGSMSSIATEPTRRHLEAELTSMGFQLRNGGPGIPTVRVTKLERNTIDGVLEVDDHTIRQVTADASSCTSAGWGVVADANSKCLADALLRDLINDGGLAEAYERAAPPPTPRVSRPAPVQVAEVKPAPPPPRTRPSSDAQVAQTLFDEAKKRVDANDYAGACPLFEGSYKADPALGALLNLADCHEHVGKTASAWTEYRSALDTARRNSDKRQEFIEKRIAVVEPKLDKLLVSSPASAPAGLVVTRDGVDITALLGVGTPVDPGEHTVIASAPGYASWQTTIEVTGEGVTSKVTVGTLKPSR